MDDSQKINDESKFAELMSEFAGLSTFAQVKEWNKRAVAEIERNAGIIRALDIEIARAAEELERVKYEKAQKSLVGRLFGGNAGDDEKEKTQRLEELRQSKAAALNAATQLQDSIDFTPTSPEQQKALIMELRLHVKELQEKKREITTVIRGPRASQPPNPQATVFDVATLERRKARYAREAELRPQETTNEALKRQIAQTDLDIKRAEKFTQ